MGIVETFGNWLIGWLPGWAKTFFSWCIRYSKWTMVLVCIPLFVLIPWVAIKMSLYVMGAINSSIGDVSSALGGVSSGGVSVASFLAKANYILPLNEMFVLFGVYVSLVGSCLVIRGLTAIYRLIPLKAS